MDIIDSLTEREQALFDLRLKGITGKLPRPSAPFCVECGNAIPDRRRETLPGVQLCVGCQEVAEVQQRNYGGRA